MAKTQYLNYTVSLPDEALVASLTAQYPDGVNRAPYNPVGPGGMAVEAANLLGVAGPLPVLSTNDAFVSPSLVSPWFDASSTFPRDVATFTRSTGWWLFGSSTKFYWIARFVYAPTGDPVADAGAGGTDVVEQAPIPKRLYLDGFELGASGEGASFGTNAGEKTPAGAVLDEGIGFTVRQQGTTASERGIQYPTVPDLTQVWSRFRVRVRRFGAGPIQLWRMSNFGNTGSGIRIYITPLGQFALYTATGSTAETLVGTVGTVPLNTPFRVDCFAYAGPDPGGTTPQTMVYFCVNGELLATVTGAPGSTLANAQIVDIRVGHTSAPASATGGFEIDIDDWRDAEWPTDKNYKTAAYTTGPVAVGTYVLWTGAHPTSAADITTTGYVTPALGFEIFRCTSDGNLLAPRQIIAPYAMNSGWVRITDSPDWLLGSRLVLARPVSAVAIANWTPADVRMVQQPVTNDDTVINTVSSTTAQASLQVLTNALDRLRAIPGVQGWAAFTAAVKSLRGTTSGTFGYKIGAAAPVLTALTETLTLAQYPVTYTPTGLTAPEALATLELHYQKGNDTTIGRVASIAAVIEALGLFAPEDRPKVWNPTTSLWEDSTADAPLQPSGLHNATYHNTPWFRTGLPPLGPVMIVGGTYTGNGTGQDLTFKQPPAFLWIRPVGGTTPGAKWFSALAAMGGIRGLERGLGYVLIPRVSKDLTFVPASESADQQAQYLVGITSAHASINTNLTVYQYIAFCDPGARFCLTGVTRHANDALPVTYALERSAFTSEFGFFHRGAVGTNTTSELWAKGTGHAADAASDLSAPTPVSAAITNAAGALTFGSGFIATASSYDAYSYSLFRREDGNADPNSPKLMAMGDYVGDGAASRSINSGRGTGLRPLFAIVIPHGATVAHYRDPSHTGTTSQLITGASQASTGISAGSLDGFTVGTSLNANGTTYSWFMFLGSATAGNNGWSGNGEFTPVGSDSPVDPTYDAPPNTFEDTPSPEPEPTDVPEEPDLAVACVTATQRLVNIALSRIGVSKVIADLVAENTMEAAIARLHIKTDVDAVLADFPWPFATRYAELVLVGGTEDDPVNVDWQYSYRAPADMVAARRMGGQLYQRRTYDPNPITFRVGSDATGALLYSNDVADDDTPLVLEYTARVSCPASTGSPLFKDALAWRFAASLAMPLSRDSQKQMQCQAMYERVLRQAEAVAANESQHDKGGDAEWITGRN